MRLEIAELAEVHLEVFEQTVDELGALGEGGDGNGRALVESLEESSGSMPRWRETESMKVTGRCDMLREPCTLRASTT